MKLSIKVDGELVRKGLQDLSAAIPKIGRQQIRTVMNRIVRKAQGYPSELPGQMYRRTGRLFYSWKIEEIQSGYAVSNTAAFKGRAYAQWVVGDAYGAKQAGIHGGRWSLFRDVVDEELTKLPPEIENEIEMVARRGGL
jgi:hypothetical protein